MDGTPLHYVKNTSGRILRDDADKKVYLLLAGRWFRADSLSSDATWEHVPGKALPKSFAEIPDSSAIENVKAAVPGTTQAAEAMIENTIPQTQTLSKKGTKFDPFDIDGPLQMKPIEGTKLQYVVNASRPVIQVASDLWFACESGVWFVATSVDGPWSVATSVSPEIYAIPASSPLHYVTYVKVYGGNSDSVYVGYTPGYTGTVVSDEGTVVYGTGYDYEPWVGSDWYGAPYTYGYGANIGWTPWYGWRYGAGYGYAYGWGGYGLGSYRGVGRWGVGDWGAMTRQRVRSVGTARRRHQRRGRRERVLRATCGPTARASPSTRAPGGRRRDSAAPSGTSTPATTAATRAARRTTTARATR